jgi:hypothetical protein
MTTAEFYSLLDLKVRRHGMLDDTTETLNGRGTAKQKLPTTTHSLYFAETTPRPQSSGSMVVKSLTVSNSLEGFFFATKDKKLDAGPGVGFFSPSSREQSKLLRCHALWISRHCNSKNVYSSAQVSVLNDPSASRAVSSCLPVPRQPNPRRN